MDWKECLKKEIVKEVKEDKNLIFSTLDIVKEKIKSAEVLPEQHRIAKICLFYDGLRGLLEAISLKRGYKVYNHECYSSFIREVLNMSREAFIFDNLRKVRNGINYYGQNVTQEESEQIIKDLLELIKKFKGLIEKS